MELTLNGCQSCIADLEFTYRPSQGPVNPYTVFVLLFKISILQMRKKTCAKLENLKKTGQILIHNHFLVDVLSDVSGASEVFEYVVCLTQFKKKPIIKKSKHFTSDLTN